MNFLKLLYVPLFLVIFGCTAQKPQFKEGTLFDAGLYLPYEGNIYGCELVSYVNGCKITVPTNSSFEVSRKHFSTNSYFFGMFQTRDTSETEVRFLKPE